MRDGSEGGGKMPTLFRFLAGVEDEGGGYGDYGAYVYWLRGDAWCEATEVKEDLQAGEMHGLLEFWFWTSL